LFVCYKRECFNNKLPNTVWISELQQLTLTTISSCSSSSSSELNCTTLGFGGIKVEATKANEMRIANFLKSFETSTLFVAKKSLFQS
jgi:hypothetical protein